MMAKRINMQMNTFKWNSSTYSDKHFILIIISNTKKKITNDNF